MSAKLEQHELEQVLEWARQRADRLLEGLDDPELRALLDDDGSTAPGPALADPATPNRVTADQDTATRDSADRTTPDQAAAVQATTRRASGRIAAKTHAKLPPPPQIGLPSPDTSASTTTGGRATRGQTQQMRAALVHMSALDDREVLEIDDTADAAEIRAAYERLGPRWHPNIGHRNATTGVRKVAAEIFLRIDRAYQQLNADPAPKSTPSPSATCPPTPSASPPDTGPRHATPRDPSAQPSAARQPSPAHAAPGPAPASKASAAPPPPVPTREWRARLANRLARRLAPHASRTTTPAPDPAATHDEDPNPAPTQAPEATDPEARSAESAETLHRQLVAIAMRHAGAKRYEEASQVLGRAIQTRPEHLPTRTMLGIMLARGALAARDLATARVHYEGVLELDPEHATAQRELLMVAALDP